MLKSLKEAIKGLQSEFLSGLGVTATQAANTSIPETAPAVRSRKRTTGWSRMDNSRSSCSPRTFWKRL